MTLWYFLELLQHLAELWWKPNGGRRSCSRVKYLNAQWRVRVEVSLLTLVEERSMLLCWLWPLRSHVSLCPVCLHYCFSFHISPLCQLRLWRSLYCCFQQDLDETNLNRKAALANMKHTEYELIQYPGQTVFIENMGPHLCSFALRLLLNSHTRTVTWSLMPCLSLRVSHRCSLADSVQSAQWVREETGVLYCSVS